MGIRTTNLLHFRIRLKPVQRVKEGAGALKSDAELPLLVEAAVPEKQGQDPFFHGVALDKNLIFVVRRSSSKVFYMSGNGRRMHLPAACTAVAQAANHRVG